MNDKFKYAPGKPGFGTKGDKGENGQQGISMYFTDLDPISDSMILTSRIQTNKTLWKNEDSFLPDGRAYVTGDLFIDKEGKTYEINAETHTYQYKLSNLNTGGIFIPLGISSDNNFKRYFNNNSSPKYIIDNVYTTTGAINYTAIPDKIYGIPPQNFARIEYTNIKQGTDGSTYAFTVYSLADPSGNAQEESNKALAITYSDKDKYFHIGNKDDSGKIRNVSLVFDVSSLRRYSKGVKINDPSGAILTNYEINANSLFDGNFNPEPDSFYGGFINASDAFIHWNLLDFLNGNYSESYYVYGDLYFYEYIPSYNGQTYRFDASIVRPMIFQNIMSYSTADGSVKITNLNPTGTYAYYMKLYRNGWSRKSNTKYLYNGTVSVTPLQALNEPSIAHWVGSVPSSSTFFNVDSNTTWSVSFVPSVSWISSLICTSSGYDGSIGFFISANTGDARSTKMRVTAKGGLYQDVSISQVANTRNVTISTNTSYGPYYTPDTHGWGGYKLDVSNGISLTNLPSDTSVNIQFVSYIHAVNNNPTDPIQSASKLLIYKNNSNVNDINIGSTLIDVGTTFDASSSYTLYNIRSSDIIRVDYYPINTFAYEINENLDSSEGNWDVSIGFNVYVQYVSGTPINITNNGYGKSYHIDIR